MRAKIKRIKIKLKRTADPPHARVSAVSVPVEKFWKMYIGNEASGCPVNFNE
jgi:hypothetical protein